MVWLYLLLALAAFAVALKSTSVALVVVCLLARRIGSQSRDESLILDPAELRRLREQAQARRAAAGSEPPTA
jgi:hypothetical protein